VTHNYTRLDEASIILARDNASREDLSDRVTFHVRNAADAVSGGRAARDRPRPAGGVPRLLLAAALAAAAGAGACGDRGASYDLLRRPSPTSAHAAAVRVTACDAGLCESLWAGPDGGALSLVAPLAHGTERASEIVWSPDGRRLGVLVNGYQLRLYDAATRAPAGQINLVPADGQPTSRVARGVTFSDNGAALTFDDCPRDRSGCRPGLVAVR
jgi:hypothetical protein